MIFVFCGHSFFTLFWQKNTNMKLSYASFGRQLLTKARKQRKSFRSHQAMA
jgi:hypothetical protein